MRQRVKMGGERYIISTSRRLYHGGHTLTTAKVNLFAYDVYRLRIWV